MKPPSKTAIAGAPRSKSKRETTVLGLAFDAGRVDVVNLRRTNGSVQVLHSLSVPLTLDPLTNDPELVGREILNHLVAAGIRARRCVVVLPLKWALITQTQIPAMAEEDVPGFLEIEAERGFPCDVSTLMLATSRTRSPEGAGSALLIGVPRSHLSTLENVLRAAQLKPASFSLGLPLLTGPAPEGAEGVLSLFIGPANVGLQVAGGGGVIALRSLEGVLEAEAGQTRLAMDLICREVRITLGQLPPDIRNHLRCVQIYGPRDLAQQLGDELELRLESLNLETEVVQNYKPGTLALKVPGDVAPSPALSLGVRHLAGEPPQFEFLPPRVSTWETYLSRYSTGRWQRAGLAAAFVAFLVFAAFAFQQVQLWRLQSKWGRLQKQALEVRELQQKTAKFRPWQDNSLRTLTIIKKVTEAFPEDGAVTAKILEIRDQNNVVFTGVAHNYQALLQTVERLRAIPEVPDVSVGPTRGQSPALQFTVSFVWTEGGKNANP